MKRNKRLAKEMARAYTKYSVPDWTREIVEEQISRVTKYYDVSQGCGTATFAFDNAPNGKHEWLEDFMRLAEIPFDRSWEQCVDFSCGSEQVRFSESGQGFRRSVERGIEMITGFEEADTDFFIPLNEIIPNNEKLLFTAARVGNSCTAERMLERGARIEYIDHTTGLSALEMAREMGHEDTAAIIEKDILRRRKKKSKNGTSDGVIGL